MKNLWIALTAMAVVTGCAKDRTLDDYCREKQEEESARIGQVSGLYQGSLVSNVDNSSLGDFTVQVKADVKPGDMKNCTGSQLEPVATGYVSLVNGPSPKIINYSNASYNSASGGFSATIEVTQATGTKATLNLTGTLQDGAFIGNLEADGYPEAGGTFTLRRAGPAVAALPASVVAASTSGTLNAASYSRVYDGTMKMNDGRTKTAQLVMLSTVGHSDQEFLYTFLPSRPWDVTLVTGPNQTSSFKNSDWDLRTHRLQGSTNAPMATTSGSDAPSLRYEATLECVETSPGLPDTGFSCVYSSSDHGPLMTGTFTPHRSGS